MQNFSNNIGHYCRFPEALIITGATSGIGFECVKQFLYRSPQTVVIGIGRNCGAFKQIEHPHFIGVKCDINNFDDVNAVISQLAQQFKIVGLINTAGVCFSGDNTFLEHSDNAEVIQTNIQGITNVIECVLPEMRQNNYGTIINLGSISADAPRAARAVYGASKAYIYSLTNSLRLQNCKYNIRVTYLAPSMIATPMVLKQVGDNKVDLIEVAEFCNLIYMIYSLPQCICVRELKVAPTSSEL